jgi:hypothetical protein
MEAIIEKEVTSLLESKIIRPSNSPWASNLVMVKKPNGAWRPCVDFRDLNKITVSDVYPIPPMDQLLYNMEGAKVFSCMDLQGAYHQIKVSEKDQKKTAFIWRGGLYEYIRMPFGLKNAPATFQRFMNMMLSVGQLRTFVMAYLDDLVVFSKNADEHVDHLRQTLSVLSRHGVKLKLSKCHFGMKKIKYLGHILDQDGVHVDPSYVTAVKDMPYPTSIQELQSFLGMCGYYRRFIPTYANIAHPLHQLLKKTTTWHWEQSHSQAADALKQALITAPVLAMPDYTKPFIIQTDASGHGIGAVLCQRFDEDGGQVERPIAYVSRGLKPAETRYDTTHLEMLAVVYGIQKFRHYVFGTKFLLQTDHRALQGLMKRKDLNGRVARWVTTLQEFDFDIEYRKGSANANADALSRLPVTKTIAVLQSEVSTVQPSEQESTWEPDEADGGIDLKELPRLQQEDPMWHDIYLYVTKQQHNELASQEEKDKLEKECEQYEVKEDGLLYHIHFANGQPQTHNVIVQLCLPRQYVPRILHEMHDEVYSGHRGTEGTYGKLVHRYWWKGMHRDTREYCRSCEVCAKRKVPHRMGEVPVLAPQFDHLQEYGPMECIAIDCIGPLPTSGGTQQVSHILTMVDVNTRMGEAVPMRRQTTENAAYQIVHSWIMVHGFPRAIICDNAPTFASQAFRRCMKILNMKVKYVVPYHPQSNGICERLNGTIKSMIGSYTQQSQKIWADILPHIVFAYNTSIHSATGYTPYYLAHGREARIGSEAVLRGEGNIIERTEYIKKIKHNMAMAHRHIQNRIDAATDARDRFNDSLLHKVSFRVGDEVYVYQLPRSDGKQDLTHKLISPYKGPYVVIKALNDVTYQVQEIATRKKKTVHVTRMKKKHNRPTHLLPPEAEQQIPILEGALDERNQEQGDQFQSHATRRQIQRQERENKIQQQSQHFMEEQEQRRQEEQERKYESQEQGHQEQPTQQEPREQQQEHMEQAQGHDEDNELEEGEVVLPPYH